MSQGRINGPPGAYEVQVIVDILCDSTPKYAFLVVLEVSATVRSVKPYQRNFCNAVTLTSTGLSRTLNGSFTPMHDFVLSCISHLENIVSLSSADFPNVDTVH